MVIFIQAIRGRAASPVRPGFILRDVLLGKTPLYGAGSSGEDIFVTEASATDIHATYRELVHRENTLRPKVRYLHGMTSESFAKLARFARLMGLVEVAREEPMIYPPKTGNFYRIEMLENEVTSVISTRKMLRLTEDGRAEGEAWRDLRKAWQEAWPIPTAAKEEAPPPAPPKKPPKKKTWKPIKFAVRPSVRQLNLMIRELEILEGLDIGSPGLLEELARLNIVVSDWQVELEDMIEDTKDPNVKGKYVTWYNGLTPVYEALADHDITGALTGLGSLT